MTFRGALRSIRQAQREAERQAQRQQREMERRQRELEKLDELDRVTQEVQFHEEYVLSLASLHRTCGDQWDWEAGTFENGPGRINQGRPSTVLPLSR